jgi:hypothetical protein
MVNHASEGGVDVSVSHGAELETEVDVIVTDGEIYLIKSAGLEKDVSTHGHASACDGGDLPDHSRRTADGVGFQPSAPKDVTRDAAEI